MSSQKKSVPWCAIVLLILLVLIVVAISIPNLMRARISADESSRFARFRSLTEATEAQDAQEHPASGEHNSNPDGRKIIQTAALDLIVANVQDTASRIQALAEGAGGYLEKSEIRQASSNQQSADLVVRVPQTRLGGIRDEIRKLAQHVEADKSDARDVTREFVDSEARLRNMKSEEAQYLELMHRSASTKDIIDITARLSDVRGRIEQLQGELQYLSHQVEMSSITIALSTEYSEADRNLVWHPFGHAKLAFRDMLEGLTGYADAMVSVVLFVPVILLWTLTVMVIMILGWKVIRWIWKKFVRTPTREAPAAQV
jgi:hypothetical protein